MLQPNLTPWGRRFFLEFSKHYTLNLYCKNCPVLHKKCKACSWMGKKMINKIDSLPAVWALRLTGDLVRRYAFSIIASGREGYRKELPCWTESSIKLTWRVLRTWWSLISEPVAGVIALTVAFGRMTLSKIVNCWIDCLPFYLDFAQASWQPLVAGIFFSSSITLQASFVLSRNQKRLLLFKVLWERLERRIYLHRNGFA